jgi:hypothetical protein
MKNAIKTGPQYIPAKKAKNSQINPLLACSNPIRLIG